MGRVNAGVQLEEWLESAESKGVGYTREGEDEAVGHRSGRRIVEIKRKKKADLSDEDLAHMKKVVGYVHRHLAQGGPDADKETSAWRYSLMNWGHDPLKCAGGSGRRARFRVAGRGAAQIRRAICVVEGCETGALRA